jgi:hypothetical protein
VGKSSKRLKEWLESFSRIRIYIKEGFGRADEKAPEIWFTPMIGAGDQPLILRDYFGKAELGEEDISRRIED